MIDDGAIPRRPRVDHTYRDFSRYLEEGGKIVKHKKFGNNFPAKLHTILSDGNVSHIISWMPHGRAWKIQDRDLLVEQVIPNYFGQTKFESFTRQLSGWGFKRLHQSGPDCGTYYHECFLRGIPLITALMVRAPTKKGKPIPDASAEPNFTVISKNHPLPPAGGAQTRSVPPMAALGNVAIGAPIPVPTPIVSTASGMAWHSTPNSTTFQMQQSQHTALGQQGNFPLPQVASMHQSTPTGNHATTWSTGASQLDPTQASPFASLAVSCVQALRTQNHSPIDKQSTVSQTVYPASGLMPNSIDNTQNQRDQLANSLSTQYAMMPGTTDQTAGSLFEQLLINNSSHRPRISSSHMPSASDTSSITPTQQQLLIDNQEALRSDLTHNIGTNSMIPAYPMSTSTSTTSSGANLQLTEQGKSFNQFLPQGSRQEEQQYKQLTIQQVQSTSTSANNSSQPQRQLVQGISGITENSTSEHNEKKASSEDDSESSPEGFCQDMNNFIDNFESGMQ